MDSHDEKYFASLVGGSSSENEGQFEVEFAKSDSAVVSRAKAARARAEDREEKWNDGEPEGQLTVDVYQNANEIVVESAIAGVRPDDIDINVTSDSIAIRGARRHEKPSGDEDYLYQECYWGRFARSIILPQEVDPENAEVTFKNGILTVHLPKVNKKKSRKLRVNSD